MRSEPARLSGISLDFAEIPPTIPHVNSRPIPLPPLSMLFTSICDSLLTEASVLLLFQYAATLSRGEGSDLFLQSGPFENFHKFFQELTCLNNLCEIL